MDYFEKHLMEVVANHPKPWKLAVSIKGDVNIIDNEKFPISITTLFEYIKWLESRVSADV